MADLLNRRRLGLMCQPMSNPPRPGWLWAADNGCFSSKWDEGKWSSWLARPMPRSGCLFAVVPDVMGSAQETLWAFDHHVETVLRARFPVALVAQDGLEHLKVPWEELDCLFIGGTTEWKLSTAAIELLKEARSKGKYTHVGRINSGKRYRMFKDYADSCDGTFLAYGPAKNLPRLLKWIDDDALREV